MSVPVNERSHGKLEACVKAKELSAYTIKITANPKVFKPEYQRALTGGEDYADNYQQRHESKRPRKAG